MLLPKTGGTGRREVLEWRFYYIWSLRSMRACSVASVVCDSLWPHGLQPTRLLCPWDSPSKNTAVGCHALLQGIFLTQGLNSRLPASPALQVDILPTEPPGKPEFEVPDGKSSGKIYQEVKGWDLNLQSGLKYPSCYWQRSSHWSYNIIERKIERKQESDLWGYTHLSTP